MSEPRLVLDVPFISWGNENLPQEELNPSGSASIYMVLRYWGLDPLQSDPNEIEHAVSDWITESGHGTSVDDLLPYLADGMPIMVAPTALTPFAHPTNPLRYELGMIPLPDVVELTSGNLWGVFLPLDQLQDPGSNFNRITEDYWWSAKVVVGYDKGLRRVLLHDPTFGPFWEVSFDDFDKMWEAGSRQYQLLHPPNRTPRRSEHHHPERQEWEDVAVCYVFGYALSSIGRRQEAEEELTAGLELEGIGDGYRYLLQCELGTLRAKMGDITGAIACARTASQLLPRHHGGWYLLANLYRDTGQRVRSIWPLMKAKCLQRFRLGTVKLPQNLNYAPGGR